MLHETSVAEMIFLERNIWESVQHDGVILLEKVMELEIDELRQVLEHGLVNTLFSLRVLIEDYNAFCKYVNPVNQNATISMYELQRDIRRFFMSADSVLDVVEKFMKHIYDLNKDQRIKYPRERCESDSEINSFRNEIIHEGVPSVFINDKRNVEVIKHANVASTITEDYFNIELLIGSNENRKRYNVNGKVRTTYINIEEYVEAALDNMANLLLR
ncbi:hypothetical protein [Brevibacillus sp. HB2.2]|uniref:hypothetical protein n=1 Tax=Brevibacillus sp. HB2.2 TaxID=2738846 RepID=UPI00156B8B4A|nr:hypothetical protein [Brevibacillus sp. HB2.2]NRS52075.1 hypothetical protein [Brevibacillus sp. HB2.2]